MGRGVGTKDKKAVDGAGLSRRSFLTGSIALAGMAGLSAAGCAAGGGDNPMQDVATPAEKGMTASTDDIAVRTHAAKLNPQGSLPEVSNTPCPSLFTEWKMGSLTIPNRITKSAAGYPGITALGVSSDLLVGYYAMQAEQGVGLLYTDDYVELYDHFKAIPDVGKAVEWEASDLARVVDAVHEKGGLIGYQLATMGLVFSGFDPDSAAIFQSSDCMDMTGQEIQDLIADTAKAAQILQDIGFDCVEINAAGENVGQTFMSRNRNMRDDDYGPQTIDSRCRFVTDIIKGIKKACGDDFPVQVLINGIEENDKSIGDNALFTTVEENKEICKTLEAAGADSLHVRIGPCGQHVAEFAGDLYFTGFGIEGTTGYGAQFDFQRHWQGSLKANASGLGIMSNVAAELRKAVSIPVGTVTYMDPARDPAFFESLIADGKIDFMHINRPLNVDPEYLVKLKEGRLDEIRPCTRCLHCHWDEDRDGNITFGCRTYAPHPYRIVSGRIPGGFNPEPAVSPKNVMVVGGGPAGMEAARVAAERGHKVSLYEKESVLGGMLDFAHIVKGPHENIDVFKNYLSHQLERTGVEVVTGKEVDVDFIKQQAPDAVIVAVGGMREALDLQASSSTKILSIDDFGSASGDKDVVIVGSNCQAIDLAMYLCAQGTYVHLVSPKPAQAFGDGHSFWVKTYTQPTMKALGVRFWPESEITHVGEGVVTVKNAAGIEVEVNCTAIIGPTDMEPNSKLADELDMEVYVVGDCKDPCNIANAVCDGNIAARSV